MKNVVIECDLPDPPEKVWRALTEPDLRAQWLEKEPEQSEVLESEPPRRLKWKQWDRDASGPDVRYIESVVSVELTVIETGTRLRIVHDNFREQRVAASGAINMMASAQWKLAA